MEKAVMTDAMLFGQIGVEMGKSKMTRNVTMEMGKAEMVAVQSVRAKDYHLE